MLNRLFKKSAKPAPKVFLVAQLNARLQPMHRGEFFEDPLDTELKKSQLGEVSGGGTLQGPNGEIEYCDIEVEVSGNPYAAEQTLIQTLEALGAPKGSKLHVEAEDREVPFGKHEGLAVYLNGADLADHVYKDCAGTGRVLSYWQGPTETAFYMYGSSFDSMRTCLSDFLATYPLCQKCRVVQIA